MCVWKACEIYGDLTCKDKLICTVEKTEEESLNLV